MASTKLTFLSISLRNFMSYGNAETVVSLQRDGATLIEGRNLDNTADGVGANGTGKSSLISAIAYGCYGKSLSDTNLDKLVNIINGKNCIVGVKFKKGKDVYEITRYRKVKSGAEGTYITIFKNGDYDNDLAKGTIPESNTFIEEHIIGMSFELFRQIVIFDADSTSFFREKAATQRAMVEDLFQLSILSEKASLLKDANKDVTSDIKIEENTIEHVETMVDSHQKQLTSAQTRLESWDKKHRNEIKTLKLSLSQLQDIDITAERKLFDQITEIEGKMVAHRARESELRLDLAEADRLLGNTTTSMNVHKRQISTLNKDLTRLERQLNEVSAEIASIEANKCPTCNQSLPDSGELLEVAVVKKEDIQTTITDTNNSCNHEQSQYDILENDAIPQEAECEKIETHIKVVLSEIKSLKKSLPKTGFDSVDELEEIEDEVNEITKSISAKESDTNPHVEAYEELEANAVEAPNYDKINELNKILDHQKLLLKLLTDKKSFIRKTLINKRLPALNDRLKYYVGQFGLPFRVEFQSDLTAKVMRFGKSMDYGNLSGGQRARLNLAVALSFRDMLESIHFAVDLCVFDEVLDRGLDDVGVMVITNYLIDKASSGGCMFVVTHKNDVASRFEQRLTVTMKNGFSYIGDPDEDED